MGRRSVVAAATAVVVAISLVGGVTNALAAVQPLTAAPAPSITFPGLDRTSFGSGWPPDISGDVGPDVYVQAVEGGFGVFRKSDGALLASTGFPALFATGTNTVGTPCNSASQSDPQVMYDTFTNRWILGVMAWGDPQLGPYYECLAASTTGDPVSGGWNLYAVQIEAGGADPILPDTPRLALWMPGFGSGARPDVYMSANVSNDISGILGVQAFAFNGSDLESGVTPANLRWQETIPDPTGLAWSSDESFDIVPTSWRTQAVATPSGAGSVVNEYFVGNSQNSDNLDIWRYHVDWTTPANSWFDSSTSSTTLPTQIAYTSYLTSSNDLSVPSPGNALSQDDSVNAISQYSAESNGKRYLWAAFAIDQGSSTLTDRTAVEWFRVRLDGGAAANQSGILSPDQASRWLPSIAADKTDNMAMGYSVTSSSANSTAGNIYPSIRYAGRLQTDTASTLGQTEQTLWTGAGYQCCAFDDLSVNDNWGSQSAMTLDPNGCTFWASNEYYDTMPTTLQQDNWKTRIGSFTYPTANCSPSTFATTLVAPAVTAGFGGTASLSATLTYSPSTGITSGVSGRTVTFTLKSGGTGSPVTVGTAVTNAAGVATLNGVSMTGIALGTYAGAVGASAAAGTPFLAATATAASLTVVKGEQTITFAAIPDHSLLDPDFAIAPTASSGLAVSVVAAGVCTLSGTTVHLTGSLGTCTLTASQAGNSNYNAATNVVQAFNVTKAPQTISFAALPDHAVGDADFGVSATASSGLAVVFSATGACSVTAGVVHLTGAGSCTVTADQAGSATYAAAPSVPRTFTIGKGSQTISFPDPGPQTVGVAFSVSATASSGLAISSFTGDANCSLVGASVTAAHTGTCVVTAHQSGDANWNAAPDVARTISIPNLGAQTITFPYPGAQTVGAAFTVSATASSGLASSFTGDANCAVVGTSVTAAHTGTCVVTAHQSGNGDWNAAPDVGVTITVSKGAQTISPFTSGNAGVTGGRAVGTIQSLSLTASSALAVAYSTTTPTICSVGVASVTFSAIGACSVVANQSGNADWNPAAQVGPYTYTVNSKGTQVLTFDPVGNQVVGAFFTVTATSSAGLTPVTYITRTPGVCSVSVGTVHAFAVGTCTVQAQQVGDANWNAATKDQSVSIGAATPQTITFGPLADRTYGDPDFGVTATASSGLAVSFTAVGTCTVTLDGSITHITGAGSCAITAHQAGNGTYSAAPDVAQSFNIAKANQTITFGGLADHTYGDADFGVFATTSSGLAASFTAAGACTVTADGSLTHLTSAGSCTITAHQSGDANRNAAPDVPQSFSIAKADQAITFAALANHTFGDADFAVTATASSGLAVTFTATGACTVTADGSVTHLSGAGSCPVTAHQPGNANYLAAPDVAQSFSIAKTPQTITFGGLANRTYGDADFAVTASASSGLAVTFTATGNCTVTSDGSVTHITGAGSCILTSHQGGDANNAAAPDVPQSFSIAKANQTITFGALANHTFGDAPFGPLGATASSGLAASYTAAGPCSVAADGSLVTITGAGSCTITAHQAGDANRNAAPDVAQSFSIAKADQTITFASIPNHAMGDPDFAVTATASSGLPVSFTAAGPCTVTSSGSAVHLTGAGSCTITAHQAGDANRNAAPDVARTFTITAGGTATNTTLVLSKTTIVHGGKVKMTGTVTAAGAKPKGTVNFLVDGVVVGSHAVSAKTGKAVFTYLASVVGTHHVQAVYVPAAGFAASSTGLATLTVT